MKNKKQNQYKNENLLEFNNLRALFTFFLVLTIWGMHTLPVGPRGYGMYRVLKRNKIICGRCI